MSQPTQPDVTKLARENQQLRRHLEKLLEAARNCLNEPGVQGRRTDLANLMREIEKELK